MKKNKKNKTYGNFCIMILFIVCLSLLSLILSILGVGGDIAKISSGFIQTSLVTINSIISKDGFLHLIENTITNFQILEPLALLIISIIATSALKKSGFLSHITKPLRKIKTEYIVFITILISCIFTLFGDYSYIVLLPLNACIYLVIGRNPLLGIISTFVGIATGYGTGLIYDYNYYLMGLSTQKAASFEVDASYQFNLLSTFYIILSSTIIISIALTFVLKSKLASKLQKKEDIEEYSLDDKSLFKTSIVSMLLFGLLLYSIIPDLPYSGFLLDSSQDNYIAMLMGVDSPFYKGFMLILLVISLIISFVYGTLSKNIKSIKEFNDGLLSEFKNIGYLLVIIFFTTIILEIVDWTNIQTVFVAIITNLLSNLQFSGLLLVVSLFIFTIIMSIILPSPIAKWSLLSPLIVPLFMQSNISPEFTQFIFSLADGLGKMISPFYIYFYIFIAFLNMYKQDDEEVSFKNVYKTILPIFLLSCLICLLIVVAWYVIGIPLGIATSTIL